MGQIIREDVGWEKLGVFICKKCRTLFDTDELKSEDPADDLRAYLKSRLKDDGKSHLCRAMTSSCQHLCEKNKQAVTFCQQMGPTKTYSLHPEENKEELYQLILRELSAANADK